MPVLSIRMNSSAVMTDEGVLNSVGKRTNGLGLVKACELDAGASDSYAGAARLFAAARGVYAGTL